MRNKLIQCVLNKITSTGILRGCFQDPESIRSDNSTTTGCSRLRRTNGNRRKVTAPRAFYHSVRSILTRISFLAIQISSATSSCPTRLHELYNGKVGVPKHVSNSVNHYTLPARVQSASLSDVFKNGTAGDGCPSINCLHDMLGPNHEIT